ncbi:MAG: hypothetical protein KAH00_01495 [Cocleimonas sp.]|nr:hypothetical protein [Cocleimonas sp.]
MFIAMIVLVTLISMIICHTVAKRRGANPVLWGALGVAFGPFAIPFVFLLTHNKNTQST